MTRKSRKTKKQKPAPTWLIFFSNKILPPLFFIFLGLITLYFIPSAGSVPLKINLGAISMTSSGLGIYITSLIL